MPAGFAFGLFDTRRQFSCTDVILFLAVRAGDFHVRIGSRFIGSGFRSSGVRVSRVKGSARPLVSDIAGLINKCILVS